MYLLCGWCFRLGSPANQMALNSVVENCETPPPSWSSSSPSTIAGAGTKPLSRVRSPTFSLSENVLPGATTVPSTSFAIRWMLVTRGAQHGWYVVNVPISWSTSARFAGLVPGATGVAATDTSEAPDRTAASTAVAARAGSTAQPALPAVRFTPAVVAV